MKFVILDDDVFRELKRRAEKQKENFSIYLSKLMFSGTSALPPNERRYHCCECVTVTRWKYRYSDNMLIELWECEKCGRHLLVPRQF